jgi:hypothetical protein
MPAADSPAVRAQRLADLAFCAATLHPLVTRIRVSPSIAGPKAARAVYEAATQAMMPNFALIEARLYLRTESRRRRLIEEDVAASVSAGSIRDRNHEMLSIADVGITRLYRTLLSCADAVEQGKPPLGIDRGIDWSQVQGMHCVLGSSDWRDLIATRHKAIPEASE